ncbi:MAG: hypothetical protein VW268_11570 [Rhodospirillaceae bacterium]
MVIHLHGCGGLGNSGKTNATMLAEAGFIVFGPDSFARPERVQTCDGKRKVGIGPKGSYGRIIGMRLKELERALAEIAEYPWVDRDRLFLFGHSQGSNAAAAYNGGEFKGRVMTETRCSRGYHALAAEPALAVFSAGVPWLRGRAVKCLDYAGTTAIQNLKLPGDEHVVTRVPEAKPGRCLS